MYQIGRAALVPCIRLVSQYSKLSQLLYNPMRRTEKQVPKLAVSGKNIRFRFSSCFGPFPNMRYARCDRFVRETNLQDHPQAMTSNTLSSGRDLSASKYTIQVVLILNVTTGSKPNPYYNRTLLVRWYSGRHGSPINPTLF
jgi:hypothetical protein